jgi:arylsulfatase A-like enzyme
LLARNPARGRIVALACAAAVAVPSCDGGSARRPSIILVTLDTTRADKLSFYGDPSVHVPTMDRWARRGAFVRDAIADVPITLPSHATILTGVPVVGHGVRNNADFAVSPDAVTVAEVLTARGYDTGAVVATAVLDHAFGLDQGFAHYDDRLRGPYRVTDDSRYAADAPGIPETDRDAREVMDLGLAWLAARDSSRPFFLWLHFYDAHHPYDPIAPWNGTGRDPYLGEIESMDHELARLARWIHASDRDVRVLLTSDHGEGFWEHDEDGHGLLLYDEAVRVPMILVDRAAGGSPGLRNAQARTIDVAPTILQWAESDRTLGPGRSLASNGSAGSELAFAEADKARILYAGGSMKMLRSPEEKWVWSPRPERYDLVRDPAERTNLWRDDDPSCRAFESELRAFVSDVLATSERVAVRPNVDDATTSRIRSLGYVSGGDPADAPETVDEELRREGFDPKDLVNVVYAGRDVEQGHLERALERVRRHFAARPEDPTDGAARSLASLARQNEGSARLGLGRSDDAVRSFRESLRLEPSNAASAWSWVYSLNLAGRPGQAVRAADSLLATRPEAARVRLHLGLACLLAGDPIRAREELERVSGAERDIAAEYRDAIGTDREAALLDHYLASAVREATHGIEP